MSPTEKVTKRSLFDVIGGLVRNEIENSEQLNIARSLVRGLALRPEEIDILFEMFEEKHREFKDTGDISTTLFVPPTGLSFSQLILLLIKRVESTDQLFVLGWVLSDAVLPVNSKREMEAIADAFEEKTGEFEMSYLLADVPDELRRLAANLP